MTNCKSWSYTSILVIINRLTKMVHYELVKVIIDAPSLAIVINNMIIQYHNRADTIGSNRSSIFISKFWSPLYYFLEIKQMLSTAFYLQTNGQTKKQNSIMEAYLYVFLNFKPDDWARLFIITEFEYNIAKNASTDYIPFKLNCGYHSHVFYKEDINLFSKSKVIDKLTGKL